MAIDPDLFPVDDLDLDRLHANLVEAWDTIDILSLACQSSTSIAVAGEPMGDEERKHYQSKLLAEQEHVELLKSLIGRKTEELENANGVS